MQKDIILLYTILDRSVNNLIFPSFVRWVPSLDGEVVIDLNMYLCISVLSLLYLCICSFVYLCICCICVFLCTLSTLSPLTTYSICEAHWPDSWDSDNTQSVLRNPQMLQIYTKIFREGNSGIFGWHPADVAVNICPKFLPSWSFL